MDPVWLSCPVPQTRPRRRLVCFPHAGGSAAFFRAWGAELADIEVHAVRYPGRGERIDEPPATDLCRLGAAIADALLPLSDVPLALFGHSMGAVVALETARSLRARGVAVAHLFASGSRAGQPPADAGPPDTEDDAESVARLIMLGGTDPELAADPDFQALVLPYIRADSAMFHAYRPDRAVPLDCPVTTIVGDADPDADLRPWPALTAAVYTEHEVPGDHFYLVERPPFALLRVQLAAPMVR
ncbi:thioesterase II family protein [Actinophytocola sp.]|uniref:thioesterase II family protein n=1 Tax=Actinophytocola sp. TaxID=1872138 RepID=UPI002D800B34|nr:alpha/beta fold hydrolase [Actinophytocola sp.]HET9138969.1 alpha/beta fold hydrolase [Actinophytocola sp.]